MKGAGPVATGPARTVTNRSLLTETESHCDCLDKDRGDLHQAGKHPNHRTIPPFRRQFGCVARGSNPGLFHLKPLVASQETCPTPSAKPELAMVVRSAGNSSHFNREP